MATKQEGKHDDFDDMVRQLREDFDRRFSEMEEKLSKSQRMERKTVDKEEDMMREFKQRFREAGEKMNDGIDRADDMVRDHPVLLVGGALAVGVALGALLSHKSRD